MTTRREDPLLPTTSTRSCLRSALMFAFAASLVGCGGAPADAVALEPDPSVEARVPTAPSSPSASSGLSPVEVPTIQIVPRPEGGTQTCPAGSVWVGTVRGRVLDLADAPIADDQVSLCGAFCLGARTRSDGRFTVRADSCFPRTAEYPHGVAFSFHGLGYHAGVTLDLNPDDAADLDAVDVPTVHAPSMLESRWVPVARQGEADQKLTLPEGFSLDIAAGSLSLPFGALERVSAARVDGAQLPLVHGGGAMPRSLFALTPDDAIFSAPAPLVLPNDQALAPDSVVEIVMIGGPATARFAPIGGLGVVDHGRVAADGRTVSADHGIPFLGWVGYRAPAN